MSQIEKLTPEQEALIPVYREKWRKIALSTERINLRKAAESVKSVYKVMGFDEPKILFSDSPHAALKEFSVQLYESSFDVTACEIKETILLSTIAHLKSQILSEELAIFLHQEIDDKLLLSIVSIVGWLVPLNLFEYFHGLDEGTCSLVVELKCILPELWVYEASYIDFCISELSYDFFQQDWVVLENLIKNCGWVFVDKNLAIICDRPLHIHFDNENRLHAEGEPAIEFADGYSLYSYHGVTLPEKYGRIHPQQWQAQWLLTETNAELRRVLIQGIGYSRICQELQAIELDNWDGYILLRIDNDFIDIEPILLLKMTCPSTGFIHTLRVPPTMLSAREAIRWVNWGIDPKDFIIET